MSTSGADQHQARPDVELQALLAGLVGGTGTVLTIRLAQDGTTYHVARDGVQTYTISTRKANGVDNTVFANWAGVFAHVAWTAPPTIHFGPRDAGRTPSAVFPLVECISSLQVPQSRYLRLGQEEYWFTWSPPFGVIAGRRTNHVLARFSVGRSHFRVALSQHALRFELTLVVLVYLWVVKSNQI
ncbi:hypothetical protein C8Q78DRAFT_994456 [Trametes maxima]|nr:hypothetical protein C8Q78DRAFT_994456 [Trametes maxima]